MSIKNELSFFFFFFSVTHFKRDPSSDLFGS